MSPTTRATRWVSLASIALLAVITAGCGSSSGNDVTDNGMHIIHFGEVGSSATLWPIYVGQSKHFFANHKVRVQLASTGSSSGTAQQIVAGSQDIGSAGLPDFIRAIDAGAPLEVVAAGVAQAPYTIIGAKGLTSWNQLRGKKVILGGPKDVTRYYFDAAAKAHGIKESDVTLTYAGSTSNRFAALSSGGTSAAILGPPFDSRALAAGYADLGRVAKYLPRAPFTGLAVSKNWAKQHQQTLEDFLRGFLESISWLRNPANHDEAVRILAKATNTTPSDASATYDYYFTKINAFVASGKLDREGLAQLISGLDKAGFLSGKAKPISAYVDSQYIEAAGKNG